MSSTRHPSRAQFCALTREQREQLLAGQVVTSSSGVQFAIDWLYAVRQWAYDHDYVGTSGGWIWVLRAGEWETVCQGWRRFDQLHRADAVAMYRALSRAADRGAE